MFNLNYRDSRPIYEQIKDGMRNRILSGAIAPDDKLPSVRDLATELAINPNTIQRAYRELESDGYIYSVPGKGSFASHDLESDQKRISELKTKLTELIKEFKLMGVASHVVTDIVSDIYAKEGN